MSFRLQLPTYQVETQQGSTLYPYQNQAYQHFEKYVREKIPCELYKDGKKHGRFYKYSRVNPILIRNYKAGLKDGAFYEIVVTPENYQELDISNKEAQFVIPARNYQENKIGEINLGDREQIRSIAQRYTDRLGDSLFTIYELLENLSSNINQYFLEDSKQAGAQAHSDAINLQNNIKTLIE